MARYLHETSVSCRNGCLETTIKTLPREQALLSLRREEARRDGWRNASSRRRMMGLGLLVSAANDGDPYRHHILETLEK